MADINTLAEEAKAAARKHAPNARAIIEAIDALAEAHQAEVATLNAEVERVRGICDRDNEMFRSTMQADLAIREGLQAEVARLTRENEGLAKDADRYRWLRENLESLSYTSGLHRSGSTSIVPCFDFTASYWDDIIDRAALAGASGAQEGERT